MAVYWAERNAQHSTAAMKKEQNGSCGASGAKKEDKGEEKQWATGNTFDYFSSKMSTPFPVSEIHISNLEEYSLKIHTVLCFEFF